MFEKVLLALALFYAAVALGPPPMAAPLNTAAGKPPMSKAQPTVKARPGSPEKKTDGASKTNAPGEGKKSPSGKALSEKVPVKKAPPGRAPPEKTSATPPAPIPATSEAGKKIFADKGCGGCHATSGPEKRIPVTERANIKGPSLWYAGSKFRPGYPAKWLASPKAFRGVLHGTMKKGVTPHPGLSPDEAKAAGAYLESLRDAEMPSGVVPSWKKIPRRVLRRARILFQKKQPCYACHRVKIRKTVYRTPIKLGGFSGPHLIDAGLRLRPDFIAAFLKNPARYNPNGRMPIYSDKAFTRLSEKDIIGLAAYISTFKEKP